MEGAAAEGLSGRSAVRGASAVHGQTASSAAPAAPRTNPAALSSSAAHARHSLSGQLLSPLSPIPLPMSAVSVHSWRTEYRERPYGHPQPGHPLPQSHNSPVWGSPRGLLSPRPRHCPHSTAPPLPCAGCSLQGPNEGGLSPRPPRPRALFPVRTQTQAGRLLAAHPRLPRGQPCPLGCPVLWLSGHLSAPMTLKLLISPKGP